MRRFSLFVGVACVLALLAQPVLAQKWSAEQQEVWKVLTNVWELEKAGDDSWVDTLHASYQSWPYESPMPLDKAGTERLIAAERGETKVLSQELIPVGIIVVGDTAVIHYFHTTLAEWADGERETFDGRATDVLTRTKDGWRILSWVGEEMGEDDDD